MRFAHFKGVAYAEMPFIKALSSNAHTEAAQS
jgi:hypothetical protein